jgi:phosphoglycolate phosphatase
MSTQEIFNNRKNNSVTGIEIMIFDLDGTLIDSRKAIIDSVNHALRQLGLEEKSDENIIKYVGAGTHDLLKNISGLEEEDRIREAVNIFQEQWETNMLVDSRLFPNVKEVLKHFRYKDMAISSNGGKEIISKTLKHFGLRKYFSRVISGDGDCLKPLACPLEKIIQLDTMRPHSIMIGDMLVDIKAGKNAGMKTCAVTYGMGDTQKLRQEDPDIMIDDLNELIEVIE